MDNVLVITTKPDLHIDMLEKHLPRVTFTVLDPKEFPNIPLSFLTDQQKLWLEYSVVDKILSPSLGWAIKL